MSMLAEPRRKQKVSLNPRGKWWTEDSNKFGQKMLEKMGWTKGKGLGANEQGVAEYSIKSTQKTSTTGIGFDENHEKWTEHHEKFSGILKQLQENQDQDIVEKKVENKDDNSDKQSLELKSKKSCARMHYHKFTRGKDINKYKSKDLANIFGQEDLSDKIQTKKVKKKESNEKETTETKDNWHGVVTINGGNMTDYFKLKSNYKNMTSHLQGKPNNNLSSNIIDNQTIDSESENEQRIGFGFSLDTENTLSSNYGISKDSSKESNYAFDNPCSKLNTPMESTSTDGPSKKSSKKRKKLKTDNLNTDEINKYNNRKKLRIETIDDNCSAFTNPALDLNTDSKKDYNDKEFEISRSSNCGVSKDSREKSKDAFDNSCLTLNTSMETINTDDSSKKKKKKKRGTDNFNADKINEDDTEKKTDTNHSNFSSFTNPALDLNSDSKEDCNGKEFEIFRSSNCGVSKHSRKKNKGASDNSCLKLDTPVETTSTDDLSKKSSKKKKKFETDNLCTDEISNHDAGKKLKIEINDNNCCGFINPALNLNSDSKDYNGKEFEVTRSSNNGVSKDFNEESNSAFDHSCLKLNTPVESTNTDDSSKKKKKKKKKLEIDTNETNKHDTRKKLRIETVNDNYNGFTNPALDLNSDSKEDCNGKEFEVSRSSNSGASKDFNEENNYAFDNPCLKLNTPVESTNTDNSSKKKKNKKKKKLETDTNEHDTRKKLRTEIVNDNCNGFTNSALDLNSDPKEDCNGKEFEISRAQFGLENCALDLTDERCDKKRVTFNDRIMLYEYDKNSIKKKKGKHTLDKFEVENKKHKKKQKCESITSSVSNGFINKALDAETLSEEINDNKLNEYNDMFPGYKVISVNNEPTSTTHSPSNANVRMSKKTLITLYHRNAISDFPGSNIYDLKGYGAEN